MSNSSSKDANGSASAVWIPADGKGPLRAVMLKKTSGGFELVRKEASGSEGTGLGSFIKEVMPPKKHPADSAGGGINVVAVDSSRAAFYRIAIPPVNDEQA